MKKVLLISLVILSFAGSAFAAALVTGTPTTGAGMSVRGGADAAAAAAAPTPLIKFSTGVHGMVNFVADAAAKTSTYYLVGTRHISGSKNFATSNVKTNIYWKQASKLTATNTISVAMVAEIKTVADDSTFAPGEGWTSY